MKQPSESSNKDGSRFKKALASVLSVSPDEIQDKLAQAKTEKPSPHKRYKYVPEEDRA